MAQLTIYLPDDVEKRVRQEARRAHKSVSAFITELATTRVQRASGWPEGFAELFGAWEGELQRPEDPPPEDVESL
jgi:predicted transcriptional regulator